MASVLVRDLSPELEAWLQSYASVRGLSVSQAAVEILQRSVDSEAVDSTPGVAVNVGDYLAETLKETLHTKDEAEQFIRSHEVPSKKTSAV
jgi:plasmid stability protein